METSIDNLGLKPLAGICTYDRAVQPGLTVDETVARLRRYLYLKTRLNEIISAHISACPEWEFKGALSLHLWYTAQHATVLRARISEMREPPLHLDRCPDERLAALMEEAIRCENSLELAVAVYGLLLPKLLDACREHIAQTHPIADHPTVHLLRHMMLDDEEAIAWGVSAIESLSRRTAGGDAVRRAWMEHLQRYLSAAGGVGGTEPVDAAQTLPKPRSDGQPYAMRLAPRRDERFKDLFNVCAKSEIYKQESVPADERVYSLLFKRVREMGVPEYLSCVMYRTRGKPWAYYADLSRQVWDEARHSMLGEIGLYAHGVPFYAFPVNINISHTFNTALTALEVHACLWGIEQSLMARETGKPFERKLAAAYGDPLCLVIQDFDWADEVLHAQIGRRWLLEDFTTAEGTPRGALKAFREKSDQKWFSAMDQLSNRSSNEDWWPDFVAAMRRGRQLRIESSARKG